MFHNDPCCFLPFYFFMVCNLQRFAFLFHCIACFIDPCCFLEEKSDFLSFITPLDKNEHS